MIVSYNGAKYTCSTALKGPDYIRLLDENGCITTSFEGVVDFSLFTVTSGDWTEAPMADDCRVAVVMPDGSVTAGSHKCNEITTTKVYKVTLSKDDFVHNSVDSGIDIYKAYVAVPGGSYDYDRICSIISGPADWMQFFRSHLICCEPYGPNEIKILCDAIPPTGMNTFYPVYISVTDINIEPIETTTRT